MFLLCLHLIVHVRNKAGDIFNSTLSKRNVVELCNVEDIFSRYQLYVLFCFLLDHLYLLVNEIDR